MTDYVKPEDFKEAEEFWFLEKLYKDLAIQKNKPLTATEKCHLNGLLCGLSPNQIALKREKDAEGVQVDICKTIYAYIKSLLGIPEEDKIENWRCIPRWLEEKGYRKSLVNMGTTIPLENLEAIVKLVKNNFNSPVRDSITVQVNISFQTSLPNHQNDLELNSQNKNDEKT